MEREKKSEKNSAEDTKEDEPVASVPLRQRRFPASFWQEPSRLPEKWIYVGQVPNQAGSSAFVSQSNLPVMSRPSATGMVNCPCSACKTPFYYPLRWTLPYYCQTIVSNPYSFYPNVSPQCCHPCKICDSPRFENRKNFRYYPV